MKKITGILLSVLSVCVLGACSGNANGSAPTSRAVETEAETGQEERAEETEKDEEQEESRETTRAGVENGQEEGAGERQDAGERTGENGEAKVLVAYFSCTNTTRPLAEYAADALGADIYEIVPETPYTEEDLNYSNSDCRANEEQTNPDSRPEISGSVEGMEEYEIVFLGYPIWWGQAPKIICTFMETYDFSGKTIIPFCTSGSSGIGSSASILHALCSDTAVWLDGARLEGNTTREEMAEWINGLGLDITAE